MNRGRTVIAVAWLVAIEAVCCGAAGFAQPQESAAGDEYETKLGTLREGYAVGEDSIFHVDEDGDLVFDFAVIEIREGYALPIDDTEFTVYTEKRAWPNPKLTLVQDSQTGDWLATDGLFVTHELAHVLLEGHTLTIVGGSDSPILIAGEPFSDTTVVVRGGVPTATAQDALARGRAANAEASAPSKAAPPEEVSLTEGRGANDEPSRPSARSAAQPAGPDDGRDGDQGQGAARSGRKALLGALGIVASGGILAAVLAYAARRARRRTSSRS